MRARINFKTVNKGRYTIIAPELIAESNRRIKRESIMRHKWDKYNNCIKCGIYREETTVKTLMVISGRNYYKYEVKYEYTDIDEKPTLVRPLCYRKTYDN